MTSRADIAISWGEDDKITVESTADDEVLTLFVLSAALHKTLAGRPGMTLGVLHLVEHGPSTAYPSK